MLEIVGVLIHMPGVRHILFFQVGVDSLADTD